MNGKRKNIVVFSLLTSLLSRENVNNWSERQKRKENDFDNKLQRVKHLSIFGLKKNRANHGGQFKIDSLPA